jgi:hypothetical protein
VPGSSWRRPTTRTTRSDDVRIDYINQQAGTTLFPCDDGRPGPCSRTDNARSIQDRVRDISTILDTLPSWFPGRVDVARAGVMGHSRGTVSTLAAAGGPSATGGSYAPDRRVRAIMGMAIGLQPLINLVNLSEISVPTLLVAGGKDRNSVQSLSEGAYQAIPSADKRFLALPNATHRSYDSTYCAQLQSAATIVRLHDDVRAVAARPARARPPAGRGGRLRLLGHQRPLPAVARGAQGHSGYAWSILGAAAQATERIPLMTYVTCPILRYHPAVVAQKAATMQILSGGRFRLGLGAGENLNEHVVGKGWPAVGDVRHEMLAEAVEIIAALFDGGTSTTAASTSTSSRPSSGTCPTAVPIGIAVSGERVLPLAGARPT